MVDMNMRGLYPILAMPFDDAGMIDTEDLEHEVEFAIDAGVDGVGLALGSEILKLTDAERDLATRTVVDKVAGRVPVVVNTGAQGNDLAVFHSRRAQDLGADAVMAAPPLGISGQPRLVKDYFVRISEAISVPIFMQDIETAPVSPALAGQIAGETENARYAKMETAPTPARIGEAVEGAGGALVVFGGYGGYYLLDELKRGSVGTMPHCAVPDGFRSVLDLFGQGRVDEAEDEFNRYGPVFRLIGSDLSSFAVVKEILVVRGVFTTANTRQPSVPPDEVTRAEIRRVVDKLGLET